LAPSAEEFEVVVVGGGPAGLSTALLLGRMRRRTLVCDSGRYRNAAARAMHGYLTRDGASPAEFLRTARAEVARYGDVTLWRGEVTGAELVAGGFAVERAGAPGVRARKLVLATGVVDELPAIAGARELYGRGVHHCPYCDGFELRDQPLAVYARDEERGVGLALLLTRWSADVALCTDGPARLGDDQRVRLARHRIAVEERPIAGLEEEDGRLARVRFRDGLALERRGLFFCTGRHQPSELPRRLGCREFDVPGSFVDRDGKTSVAGLYIVGDASRDVLQVVVAAAEGCEAAIALNNELLREDGVLPRE